MAQGIKTDQAQFTLPVSLYSDYQNAVKDDISVQLMPSDSHPELIPMKSYGDGNCLFRSLSLTTAAVEWSHSGLKIVKSKLQSRMGEGRFNALMLLYLHKDIPVNYERIIDIYANRFPHRMRFSNPMQEK